MEDPDLSLDAEEETQLLQVSAPSLVETLRVFSLYSLSCDRDKTFHGAEHVICQL